MAAVNDCPVEWMDFAPRFGRPEDIRRYVFDRFSMEEAAPILVGMALGVTLAEARRDR